MTDDCLNEPGIVYVLTNPSMPGQVKIGWTSRSAEQRSDELFTTGVSEPFVVAAAYRVPNALDVERALHEAFGPYRVNPRREFFRVEPDQVRAILGLLGTAAEDMEEVTDEVNNDPSLIPETIRRPQADFVIMGIPVGADIVFAPTGAIAKIASRRTVLFEGEEMALSTATERIAPDKKPSAYKLWRYGDEALWAIYDRSYPR